MIEFVCGQFSNLFMQQLCSDLSMCCNYRYMLVGDSRIVNHENWVDKDADLKLSQTAGEFEVNH